MQKLVIAIDCDDVLVPSTETIVDLYNKRFGTNVTYARAHQSGNEEWGASRDETERRIHEVQLSDEYAEIIPFPEAVSSVRQLAEAGHELHMVTARDSKLLRVTETMLEKYFDDGVLTTLEHVGFGGTKGDICKKLGADVLIDDNLKHLEYAAGCGVGLLLWFGRYPWQGDTGTTTVGIKRCGDWREVTEEIQHYESRR